MRRSGRGQTDRHTDARDHNTYRVVYDSPRNVKSAVMLCVWEVKPGTAHYGRLA